MGAVVEQITEKALLNQQLRVGIRPGGNAVLKERNAKFERPAWAPERRNAQ